MIVRGGLRNAMSRTAGDYECQGYSIQVAGMTLRLLGPKYPHALNDDPRFRKRSEEDGYKPYWALPSPAAVMLAEHVIRHLVPAPDPVLELGAGLGIVGIALSMAGHRVVVTDYDEDALAFVRASAELNRADLHDVRPLDWRDPPPERYGVIVGSEIAYEKRSHQPIATLLDACLKPEGRAFISDLNRTSVDEFPDALRLAGFIVGTVQTQAKAIPAFDATDGRVLQGRVFRIARAVAVPHMPPPADP
jgi:predicted nicotinamide N-methyase